MNNHDSDTLSAILCLSLKLQSNKKLTMVAGVQSPLTQPSTITTDGPRFTNKLTSSTAVGHTQAALGPQNYVDLGEEAAVCCRNNNPGVQRRTRKLEWRQRKTKRPYGFSCNMFLERSTNPNSPLSWTSSQGTRCK